MARSKQLSVYLVILVAGCRFDLPEVGLPDAPADARIDARVDAFDPGGCKVLASFETNAREPLNTSCGTCHSGQIPAATAAMNLTGVHAPNAMSACNEVRLRVSFIDIPGSAIFVNTDPNGNAVHPYKFGGNTMMWNNFKNVVTPWIAAERDAL